MTDQGVTDEQLTEWERGAAGADRVTGGCLWWPSAVTAMIADLRVSRAREAEWRAATDEWQQRFIAASELAERQQAYREDAEAERDELQQRIDRALALCELLITNATPRQVAGPHEAHNAAVLIRAVLTETKQDT